MTRNDYDFDELVRDYGAEYVQEYYPDDMLYPMDEISEFITDVWEALRSSFFGYDYNPYRDENREQFNPNRDYFAFNAYGNLVSIDAHDYVAWLSRVISEDEFVDWCVEQGYIDEPEDEDDEEDIEGCKGVGGVDWYHAVWVAQNELGVDFNKSYFSHPQSTMYELADLGKRLGYRRSYDNGKSYGRAFFDALARRADKINAEMARYDR